jgi:hypothetical protein
MLKKAILIENEAKKKLEDEMGFQFEHSIAYYEKSYKKWVFDVIFPDDIAIIFNSLDGNYTGNDFLLVSEPSDFEPFKTLSEHLEKPLFEILKNNIWNTANYGYDWKIGSNNAKNLFCYTGEGWLEIAEIESSFISKFTEFRKNHSLNNEKWSKIKIFKNCCRGISYKKKKPDDEWVIEYECILYFKDIQNKIIKTSLSKSELQLKKTLMKKRYKSYKTKKTKKIISFIKTCSFCNENLNETSKYCRKCGLIVLCPEKNVAKICPNCGTPKKKTPNYCRKCGAKQPIKE